MGNTHFFIIADKIGYFLGNTQFALLEIKLYGVWGLYLWALKGVKDKGGYCVGNTQFFIIVGRIGYFLGNTQFALFEIKLYVVWGFIYGL